MELFDKVLRQWALVKPVLGILVAVAIVAAGVAWRFTDYHYAGLLAEKDDRIGALNDTLHTKEFPQPKIIPRVVQVPVADPRQAAQIQALQNQLAEDAKTINELRKRGRSAAASGKSASPQETPIPCLEIQYAKNSDMSGNQCINSGGAKASNVEGTTVNQNSFSQEPPKPAH